MSTFFLLCLRSDVSDRDRDSIAITLCEFMMKQTVATATRD